MMQNRLSAAGDGGAYLSPSDTIDDGGGATTRQSAIPATTFEYNKTGELSPQSKSDSDDSFLQVFSGATHMNVSGKFLGPN